MNASEVAERAYRTAKNEVFSSVARRLTEVTNVVEGEAATMSDYPMSRRRRLWLWRHGFQSRTDAFYDFDAHDPDRYLSDLQVQRTALINGRWKAVFENKLVFHWLMGAFPSHRSTVYGLLADGKLVPVDAPAASGRTAASALSAPISGGTVGETAKTRVEATSTDAMGALDATEATDASAWFDDHLAPGDRFVLKPVFGGFGNDVHICSKTNDGYVLDGERTTAAEFDAFVAGLDDYLVSEFARQAAYADAFYPETPNTLRIMTMWDVDREEPFVPIATQRIGTSKSAPLDNWSQGAVMSEIDVETGELGPAATKPAYGTDWHPTHPETGAQIEGVTIPGWEEIRDGMLEIAAGFDRTPYAGWDVVVTGEGEFTIIEGNNKPSIQAMQTYRPLLADPRVRRFYEHYDVI
ncbi:sugar-transfer associated ATP-grasp domain-containing protein [Halegenticoccus tardaugens]|uniref:sugar-transfer associated ATP-grasp domain-containing protein n=1 Tax=Halegenticoccus tardaugens TaxID=2071624 RepID=UPI00100C10F7|nr:sugar-transfer associated ATP-grasp domain-containing protein [Halegenticoccus tardaugens]